MANSNQNNKIIRDADIKKAIDYHVKGDPLMLKDLQEDHVMELRVSRAKSRRFVGQLSAQMRNHVLQMQQNCLIIPMQRTRKDIHRSRQL